MHPFVLPVGVSDRGNILRDFSLTRPLSSLRNELRDAPRTNVGLDVVALQHVLSSLGPISRPKGHLVKKLTFADRNYIHAFCTAGRYEGDIPLKTKCKECEADIEDAVTFSDVGLTPPKFEYTFKDDRVVAEVPLDLPSGDRFPVVAAVSVLGDLDDKPSTGKSGAQRVAKRILSLNGKPVKAEDLDDLGKFLGLQDNWSASLDAYDLLEELLVKIDEGLPQFDPEANVTCPTCGCAQTVSLTFEHWLLPFSPPKGRKN